MENKITEEGKRRVQLDLKASIENFELAMDDLRRAAKYHQYMQLVAACDHELYEPSGIELIQTRCKKCNYSWYD